jgi:hypothetical protein
MLKMELYVSHCGSNIALFINIFCKLYLVKYIYKGNILKEVYISHCGSKISLLTNILFKIYIVKYIYKANILKEVYISHCGSKISLLTNILYKIFCKKVISYLVVVTFHLYCFSNTYSLSKSAYVSIKYNLHNNRNFSTKTEFYDIWGSDGCRHFAMKRNV